MFTTILPTILLVAVDDMIRKNSLVVDTNVVDDGVTVMLTDPIPPFEATGDIDEALVPVIFLS